MIVNTIISNSKSVGILILFDSNDGCMGILEILIWHIPVDIPSVSDKEGVKVVLVRPELILNDLIV